MERPDILFMATEDVLSDFVIQGSSSVASGVSRSKSVGVNATVNAEVGDGIGTEYSEDEEYSSAVEGSEEESSNSDNEDSSLSDYGGNCISEVQYTEEDIHNLLDEFFYAEQEAVEAQEKLEDESLKTTRSEVSLELSETKSGSELEAAVEEEMATFTEICVDSLAELEDKIAILQENLEDSGQNLPELYKMLEKQLPMFCKTEVWRKRTHWAGLPATPEVFEVIQRADLDLEEKRPVRRHHGRIQDEGASGFLVTKVKAKSRLGDVLKGGWSSYDVLDDPGPGSLMGTEKWANVYQASTPEQAAQMGLVLPGVDIVEEIGDLDADKSKLFREALANEREHECVRKDKISLKKVCEEDDVKKTKKLQRKHLPRRPQKLRPYAQKTPASYSDADAERSLEGNASLSDELNHLRIEGGVNLSEPVQGSNLNVGVGSETLDTLPLPSSNSFEVGNGFIEKTISEPWIVDSAGVVHPKESRIPHGLNGEYITSRRPKRRLTPTEVYKESNDSKRSRTVVMIDSDGEHEVQELANDKKLLMNEAHTNAGVDLAEVVVLGSRMDTSQRVQLESKQSGIRLISSPQGEHNSDDEFAKLLSRKRRSSSALYHDSEPRNFSCTACGMLLKKREVMKHPSLDVGICRKCKNFLFSGPFNKDDDGHEDECRWCGQGGDVLCCESCDKVFCCPCIKRNFGCEVWDRIADSEDWKCFFCNKQPLHALRLQYQALKDTPKALQVLPDAEDSSGTDYRISRYKKRNRRRNIRRVLDDGELDEKTKHLLAREKERQELLESWRAKAKANGEGPSVKPNQHFRNTQVSDILEMDGDDIAEEGFILNKARADNEEPIRICSYISRILKPHQLAGMRFMWENCIESVSKVRSGADGLGCILAHSMGLGKTLQVIGFVHTLLKKMDLGLGTVLIVVPVNVLHNWRSEFRKWQPGNEAPIPVYMLEDAARDNLSRSKLLANWKRNGGVMLIGYTAFRNLSTGRTVKDKSVRESLCLTLQDPGPDILVCDEAHMIKNHKADITQALRQVRTHRRIALTGSPLQNNLQEYYCMVDFVREGFLGLLPEFRRRFSAPIENGQRADSTSRDVKLMKHRAHVLHKQLMGFVQRKTMNVLKDELPSKCVYVISVRLSALQRALYLKFLQINGFLNKGASIKKDTRNMLFQAYHTLAKTWNHPDLLILAQEEKNLREDNVENFIVDKDDDVPEVVIDGVIVINEDETVKEISTVELKSNLSNGRTVCQTDGNQEEVDKSGWWKDMMDGQARQELELSGKMVILMKILSLSSARSDKALVFSQSLQTLDLIEVFLESMPCLNGFKGNWKKNRDWYRLDGQTSAKARQDLVERFNDPENARVQCVLISTRAGSLGINLPAANRVIIFDGSWNPTHDLQALFRAWRFGQTKNVYAYRLLASGTMEEKIYNRQVAKEGLAARVLDEHQVARHFVEDDLEFFYVLDKDDYPEVEDSACKEAKQPVLKTPQDMGESTSSIVPGQMAVAPTPKPKVSAFSIPDDAPPRDDVMGKLLLEYRPKWIGRYHEHEPLLEDLEDEKLSKEEQALAWETFHCEQSAPQYSTSSSSPAQTISLSLSQVQENSVPSLATLSCAREHHIKQLIADNVKSGTSSVCGRCDQIISWEAVRRHKAL